MESEVVVVVFCEKSRLFPWDASGIDAVYKGEGHLSLRVKGRGELKPTCVLTQLCTLTPT